MKMDNMNRIGMVTQTGAGVPNNQYAPDAALVNQPSAKPLPPGMLLKETDGSAHTVAELKFMKGK